MLQDVQIIFNFETASPPGRYCTCLPIVKKALALYYPPKAPGQEVRRQLQGSEALV